MIVYWSDDNFAGRDWDRDLIYGLNPTDKYFVMLHDRFSYEDMIIAKCDTKEEAELVIDAKYAENKDRHLTNPIETIYSILPPRQV